MMTDNEIIKALESIASASIGDCQRDCAFYDGKVHFCGGIVAKHSLDIINRQKAEIERLRTATEEAIACYNRMESLYRIKCVELKVAKAEAIKEFAERVRELTKKTAFADCWSEGGFLDSIDNLVKEMTEEEHDGKS
jgi:hypothetical protein